MTSSSPAFNPGIYYVNALIVPNESAPATIGSSCFCLVVVKVVSWDPSQSKYFVPLSLREIWGQDTAYWVAEDKGGLLKPMCEVGEKVCVRSLDPMLISLGLQHLLATIVEREVTLSWGYDMGHKLDLGTV